MSTNKTIICAYEHRDSIMRLPLPNGCSPSWYINELGNLDYPHTLGEYLLKGMLKDEEALRRFIHPEYQNVKYVEKQHVFHTKYLYIIPIYQVEYFHKSRDVGLSVIGLPVLNDIRAGLCHVVFVQDVEGMSGVKSYVGKDDFTTIQAWCEKENLPPSSVHYLCANLKSKDLAASQGCTFNVVPITTQEMWVNYFNFAETPVEYKPVEKKVYLNYSRRPRNHRVILSSELSRQGVFDAGINSFHNCGQSFPLHVFPQNDTELIAHGRTLWDRSPIIIDRDNDSDDIAVYMRLQDYEQTFLSLVSETIYEPESLFMSEKTWKPIIVGHPFILLGPPGILAYLHSQGFKTFDRWIDESYDNIANMHERVHHIVGELKRLNGKTQEELIAMRKEMHDTLVHNLSLIHI